MRMKRLVMALGSKNFEVKELLLTVCLFIYLFVMCYVVCGRLHYYFIIWEIFRNMHNLIFVILRRPGEFVLAFSSGLCCELALVSLS